MTGLRIVLWTTFCAPFVDARNATRAQALLLRAVGLFVFPLAYAWYFLFRPKKGGTTHSSKRWLKAEVKLTKHRPSCADSAVASLQDVPATVSCDWNLVGQEWVVSRRFAALRAPETSRYETGTDAADRPTQRSAGRPKSKVREQRVLPLTRAAVFADRFLGSRSLGRRASWLWYPIRRRESVWTARNTFKTLRRRNIPIHQRT